MHKTPHATVNSSCRDRRGKALSRWSFCQAGHRRMGHRIDLDGRINGNFKIRRSSFF